MSYETPTLPLVEPNVTYQVNWLDSYYDQTRHDKVMKPKFDLVVRGLFRAHDDVEVDQTTLPLYRYVFSS